jgi:SAM-dependent methyltransferase
LSPRRPFRSAVFLGDAYNGVLLLPARAATAAFIACSTRISDTAASRPGRSAIRVVVSLSSSPATFLCSGVVPLLHVREPPDEGDIVDLKWYENFFQGIVLEMWRKAVPPGQTRLEVDFLERALKLEAGARVLDVPCGLGRHSLELASRGYRVTGVDLSPQMIEECCAASAQAGLSVEWLRSDMRLLPWESEFDAAFCFGNSIAYIDPAGTCDFLRAAARALKPGAGFALDYGMSAESILPRLREREWAQVDDIFFLEENRYRVPESCVETTYTFVKDGCSETRSGLQWVHTVRELGEFLREVGLEPQEMLGSLDGQPFGLASPLLILVSRKL